MARIYIARTGSVGDLIHGPDVVNNTVLAQGGIVVISSTSGMQTVGIGQTALADGLRYVNISDMGIDFNNQTPVTAGQGFTNTAIWQEIFDEIESGATFPGTSLTDGRIFWLTATQGSNFPGIYRYNTTTSMWEGAIVGATAASLDSTAHTLTIDGTVYRIGDLDGRTSEEITAQIEASTGNVGTGLHIISDVAVENLSGDVTWSSQNWNGSSTTGNVSHLAVQYTTVDSSLAVGTFVQARSATGMLTHTFQIIGIGPGGGSLSGNNYYFFNAGPHSLQNVRIAGSTHGNNPAVLAALNAQNDWTFTHIVDSDFHLLGAGDGISIDVENDEATISADFTGLRVGPGSVFDFMNITGLRSDPTTGNKLSIAQVGDDAANNRVSINVRDEILGVVTTTYPAGLFPGNVIEPGFAVSFSGELYEWTSDTGQAIIDQADWDLHRPGIDGNWVRLTQSGSRIQQGSQIYTEFGRLLFVSRIGNLQVQNVNVTDTGTTIAYPTALNIADGNFIMAEYPGLGVVFYRVEVDGTTITNHPYTSIGVDGQPFTVPNGAYMDIRYARLEDVSVPAGWFGVIAGRANDGTTYNNTGVVGADVEVTRVASPDSWTITTAYDGTDGMDLTTTIATR